MLPRVSVIGEQLVAVAAATSIAINNADRRPRMRANAIMVSRKLFLKPAKFTTFGSPRIHGCT
jgi:hypothetical protein